MVKFDYGVIYSIIHDAKFKKQVKFLYIFNYTKLNKLTTKFDNIGY